MNKLGLFNSNVLLNKHEIIDSFEQFEKFYLEGHGSNEITEEERDVFSSLCEKFKFQLYNKKIHKVDTPWNFYEYKMTVDGLELSLYQADEDVEFDENFEINYIGQTLINNIISVKAPYYTVQEFAKHHKVTDTTVRQWIRRGKIRNAKKIASEWRIPAITNRPERGYTPGNYFYDELPLEILSQYPELKNTKSISIYQDDEDKNKFLLFGYKYGFGKNVEIELDVKEREKLELSLISIDEVEVDGVFSNFNYSSSKATLKIPFLNMRLNESEKISQVIIFEVFFEKQEFIRFTDDFNIRSLYESEDFFVRKLFKIYSVPNDMVLNDYLFYSNHNEIAETLDLMAIIDLTLILNSEMNYLEVNPLIASDEISGDLFELVNQLSTDQGPLSYDYGDPFQNVILINNIDLEKNFKKLDVAKQIISTVPVMVWKFFNQRIEVLSFIDYPCHSFPNHKLEDNGFIRLGDSRVFYCYTR